MGKMTSNDKANEVEIAAIKVIAIPPMYSLLGPSPTMIGIKANAVVAVAASNGRNKCLTDAKIASFEERPSSFL